MSEKGNAGLHYLFFVVDNTKNGLILDLFSGSGVTSLVAASMERNFIGAEQDFSYVRRARARMGLRN